MSLERKYQDSQGNHYIFKKALGNRGQPGQAGFYEDEKGNLFVIKEDDIATCIQEGSARFVEPYLPKEYKYAINLAWTEQFGEDKNNMKVVTIQPAIQEAKSLHMAIFGEERNPKTLISPESWNEQSVLNFIRRLSDHAKATLAVAIFAKVFMGDESLHTGQFLVSVIESKEPKDEKIKTIKAEQIKDIIGIDTGASERHALQREADKDFKHDNASNSYTGKLFSQAGNNYIKFLINDIDVRAKYVQLWIRSADKHEKMNVDTGHAADLRVDAFREALSHIPDKDKKKTIEKVYEIYAKGFKTKNTNTIDQNILEETIRKVVSVRVGSMQKYAKSEFYNIFLKCDVRNLQLDEKNGDTEKFLSNYIFHPFTRTEEKNDDERLIKFFDTMTRVTEKQPPLTRDKIDAYYALLAHLHAAIEFREDFNVARRNKLLKQIESLQDNILKKAKAPIKSQEEISPTIAPPQNPKIFW